MAAARRAAPLSTRTEESPRVSAMVEQAPYCPRKGIPKERRPKVEEMHWFSRSPASKKSMPPEGSPLFPSASSSAFFCSMASAFSQLSCPRELSEKVWSKQLPRGPSASFFPPTAAQQQRAAVSSERVFSPIRCIMPFPSF